MNITESDNTNASVYTLDNFNSREITLFYIHILLLDILLFVTGVVGNSLVLYVYHFKLQRTVFTLLVRVLAVIDLISVSVNIPLGVFFKFVFLHPNDFHLCRVYIFFEHFLFCISGLLFVIIALQRYRKLCKVFKEQIQLSMARKLVLAALVISVCISLPLFFTTSGGYIEVTYGKDVVKATTCDYNDETKKSGLAIVGAVLFDFEFFIITFVLAVLYFRIARKYQNHRISHRNLSFRRSLATKHMTKIFSMITVFFLFSMTPVLICSTVFAVTTRNLKMSMAEFVLFDIGIILPYFHSIINPVVYGITIKNFRRECKKLLFRDGVAGPPGSSDEDNKPFRETVLMKESISNSPPPSVQI